MIRYLCVSTLVFFFCLPTSILVGQENSAPKFRIWETQSGRKSDVKLRLVKQTANEVQLEREDNGKTVTLKLSQLSRRDQRYLERLGSRETKPPQTSTRKEPSKKTQPQISSEDGGWPQWRGPNRDGKSTETGLADKWPEMPPIVWNTQGFGEGFSTPSATSDAIFLLGTAGNRELLFRLDWDGNIKWKTPIGAKTDGGGYPGPRGAPTIHKGVAYSMASDGSLSAVDTNSGKLIWQKNMKRDFGGNCGHWGFAESPLIDGNQLICTPGSADAAIVALRLNDGRPIWSGNIGMLNQTKSGYSTAGYASPVVAEIQGVRQYIVFLQGGVVGFAAQSGEPLWHYESPANDTANCSTPIVFGDSVFAASGYNTGGGKIAIQRQGRNWNIREMFFARQMVNHHGGVVLHEGYLYGTNEFALLCLDWRSGKIKWQDRSVGKGSVTYADGKLIVRGERGRVALVKATPDGYQELGNFNQPFRSGKQAWPHPVVAQGKLLLHDGDRLICFDIRAKN